MALGENTVNRVRGCKPQTAAKYSPALELYAASRLSVAEICRRCGVSVSGFSRYISAYHRQLMLERNGIRCTPAEAADIKINPRRGQFPAVRARYRDAIAACDSMDYIEYNVSEIAREFGLDGTNLANQLRRHYPGVLEFREQARRRLGLADNLPRGVRPWCEEQYAGAVELLRADRYVTVQDAADLCNVSCTGLEQHLIFYHSDLVENRIGIRKRAVSRRLPGEITGRGTPHAPAPETAAKYAEALRLFRTTPLPAAKIARLTGVSAKGFYDYLQTWHADLVRERNGVSDDGRRRHNPATDVKYADAIARLREGGISVAKAAAEFGLHPESLRQYLKTRQPQLHASLGRTKTADGKTASVRSMEKYKEAVRLYQTGSESLRSIAARLGFSESSLRQYIRHHFPELITRRKLREGEAGQNPISDNC